MKRLDKNALISRINSYLSNAEEKWLTKDEIITTLKDLGLNPNITRILIPSFNKSNNGRKKKYMLPKSITLEQINKAYEVYYSYSNKSSKKECNANDDLIAEAKSRGLGIVRILGFDEEAFAKDYPDLYKKYLRYEIL